MPLSPQALDGTEGLLEKVPSERLAVPRQDDQTNLRGHVDSESDESVGRGERGSTNASIRTCSDTATRRDFSKPGVDLLTISKLLGHASFVTTMIYLHCRREH